MLRSTSKYPCIRRLRIDTIDCHGHIGSECTTLQRNLGGGFPGNFDGSNDCEQQLAIAVQIATIAAVDEIAGRLDGFHHVEDSDAVVRPHTALRPSAILHHGNAG